MFYFIIFGNNLRINMRNILNNHYHIENREMFSLHGSIKSPYWLVRDDAPSQQNKARTKELEIYLSDVQQLIIESMNDTVSSKRALSERDERRLRFFMESFINSCKVLDEILQR
jgi:uncharacterized coiled-coil protein SlyX